MTLLHTTLEGMADSLADSYAALREALLNTFIINEAVVAAKTALETARGDLLLDGRLDGKNEALREAQARRLLVKEATEVEVNEALARRAKNVAELARLDVEARRAQLRVMELAAVAERYELLNAALATRKSDARQRWRTR